MRVADHFGFFKRPTTPFKNNKSKLIKFQSDRNKLATRDEDRANREPITRGKYKLRNVITGTNFYFRQFFLDFKTAKIFRSHVKITVGPEPLNDILLK